MPQTKRKPRAPKATDPETFTPPPVGPGDIVLWCQHGRQERWYPALVDAEREDGCLHLHVFVPNRGSLDSTRKAVYHVDDPRTSEQRGSKRRDGMWRLTPQDEALRKALPDYAESLRDAIRSVRA